MLQVASGLLRGLSLRSPTGKQTRPSSERLRQSLFNILRHYRWLEPGASPSRTPNYKESILDEAVVIDLFAGTGAFGIEAMSNGAAEVWFVESHHNALRTLEDNLTIAIRSFEAQSLAVPLVHLVRKDAILFYKKLPKARILFCDPPYDQNWFEKVLKEEEGPHGCLETGGVLIYEAAEREPVPALQGVLKLFDTKIYGDSAVHFFVKTSSC